MALSPIFASSPISWRGICWVQVIICWSVSLVWRMNHPSVNSCPSIAARSPVVRCRLAPFWLRPFGSGHWMVERREFEPTYRSWVIVACYLLGVALGKVMSGGSADPGSLVSNFHWHVLFFAFRQRLILKIFVSYGNGLLRASCAT